VVLADPARVFATEAFHSGILTKRPPEGGLPLVKRVRTY
jgi:hypothetical protein